VAIGHNTAREGEVINRATASLQPGKQARSCVSSDLELDGSACLLLDHHRSRSDGRPSHECADLDLHQIAASKLAVYRKIEKCSVSHPSFSVEEEADRPYLSDFQCPLGANLSSGIPGRSSCSSRVVLRDTHYISPSAEAAVGETIVARSERRVPTPFQTF